MSYAAMASEQSFASRCLFRFLNIVYTLTVVSLLLYAYVFDVIGCQWVISITNFSPIGPAKQNETNHLTNLTTTTEGQVPFSPVVTTESCGPHWVTTYVVPNVLHFVAYLMGFIYFRLMRSEQLYALIERVFLNSALIRNRSVMSLRTVIRKLRIILANGFSWVVLATGIYAFYLAAFPDHSYKIIHDYFKMDDTSYYIVLTIRSIGCTLANLVTLTVVFNFVVQCEMLCFYFQFIFHRLREKAWNINDAFKHVFNVMTMARDINMFQSHLTSVALLKCIITTSMGLVALFQNDRNELLVKNFNF